MRLLIQRLRGTQADGNPQPVNTDAQASVLTIIRHPKPNTLSMPINHKTAILYR